MARLPRVRIARLLQQADQAATPNNRGALLEEAIALLFSRVPGVEIADRNVKCVANTEEIDILCWNERRSNGLYHLETPFLVECKNWGQPVPGHEVVYFANSMRTRSCRDGVLVASNGITGAPGRLEEAHFELANALGNGQRILVINRQEIEGLRTSLELSELLKKKMLDLTVNLTLID